MAADLNRYIRHAERFGVDAVFETASAELRVHDLGRLNLRLQRIDSKWRLPPEVARALATRLVAEGVDEAWACRAAGISRRTLRRAIQAPEPAFQSGETWTSRPAAGHGVREAELSVFDPPREAA